MFQRILSFGARRRLASLIFLLVCSCAAATGLPRLAVDTGFNSLISDTHPDKAVYDRVSKEFGSDNATIVFLRDPELWSVGKLAALDRLHRRLEKLPFVERVESLFSLQSIREAEGELAAQALLPEVPKEQAEVERARDDALANPLFVGNFISKDGAATAINLTVREDRADDNFDRKATDAIEAALSPARGDFEQLFQVGPPRINAELKSSLFDDLILLGPLSTLALTLSILLFFRSGFAALIPLITASLSILWTFGMMGHAGIPLNILSAMLPSLILVIGSTEDAHMLAAYFQGVSGEDEEVAGDRKKAVGFMLRHMGVPLVLTVLTTGLGFASNLFSDIGLIRDFALASTFAIFINGVITLLVVPMILATFGPLSNKLFAAHAKSKGMTGALVRFFDYAATHFSGLTLAVTGGLCLFFLYFAAQLYVTNDPLSYFRTDHPLVAQTHRVHRDLAGIKVFYITLESDREKAFQLPENLEKLRKIKKFLDSQKVFDKSLSVADHIGLVNREFHGGNPYYDRIPASRELAAQYLMFFHRRDLEKVLSRDLKRANIVVRHNITDSHTLNRYVSELKKAVNEIAGSEIRTHVVGENLMVNRSAETLLVAQVESLGLLLFIIFLMMSAMFTSFKGGLIALIPNLVPITLMFGFMGLAGIPLNPGTAMVAVIAVGIAIDDTIHLLSRYNELCRRTSDYAEAVRQTVHEEAAPVISTSLALVLGFGMLLFSNFNIVAQFGALSAATMLFAIISDLLITPIIISRVRLVGLSQILEMDVSRKVLEESPLFQDMSYYQARKAVLISKLGEYRTGDVLVEQGTSGRSMYLILSGRVEVHRREEAGGEGSIHLATLESGEIFGEIGYIQESERTADVVAVEPVQALIFNYEKLKKDLKFFPNTVAKLNFNISRILGERLAEVVGGLKANKISAKGAWPDEEK